MKKMNNAVELLEKCNRKYSNRVFLDDGEKCWSYSEIITAAKEASKHFLALDSKVVCFMMEKSADAIINMFGSIYAGKCYVFINSTSPIERVERMLKVAGTNTLYLDEINYKRIEDKDYGFSIRTVSIENNEKEEEIALPANLNGKELLYGMFTSGTTGEPKMVVANHESVISFIEDFVATTGIDENDIIGNQAPFDFDVSVKDIYSCLYCGARLVLVDKEYFTRPNDLLGFISEHRINTLIWAVTALCLACNADDFSDRIFDGIRNVFFSGEVMPMRHLRIWHNALPRAKFINLYGPTEVICNCTWHEVKANEFENERIPIGIPLGKRDVILLDEYGKIIEEKYKCGEICVGGECLSNGYYNNTLETDKRFVPYNSSNGENNRIYHTGDLAIRDDRGLLFFEGRKDFQVKRMGHRIELEEIDGHVLSIEGVRMACSIYDENTQKLCTFYTGEVDRNTIRKNLRKKLPVYMLPNRIVDLKEIPINKNGKIDRNRIKEEQCVCFN